MRNVRRGQAAGSQRSLIFERLETRTLLAGNVAAVVAAGDLEITGEAAGNANPAALPSQNRREWPQTRVFCIRRGPEVVCYRKIRFLGRNLHTVLHIRRNYRQKVLFVKCLQQTMWDLKV